MKGLKFHRAIVAIAMMFIGWLPSLAHDFEVDGIYYNLINDFEVEVTYKGSLSYSYDDEYIYDIVIPSSVNYEGTTYSVISIGEYAFYDCDGLTSIEIPNSVTSIRNYAFMYCSNLPSFVIHNSITSIDEGVFYNCSSLVSIEIPNSVTSIGGSAFYGCTSLTSIRIPNSVTTIENRAFEGCEGLSSIIVDSDNAVYDTREDCNAIIETDSNTLIAGCQNTIIPNSVTSIGSSAFSGCTSLTNIEIPSSITTIGNSAFYYCINLTSVEIPNSIIAIEDYAFSECINLTSIQIPNSVTSIGEGAFYDCYSLSDVVIGNSVTRIGGLAFSDCSNLIKITCLTDPPVIESNTFTNYMVDLYVPTGCRASYEAAEYWRNFSTIIELESELVEKMSFEYEGITYKVTVKGKELAVIASESGYYGYIIIPSSVNFEGKNYSVTSIGDYAFADCTNLSNIEIPNTVTSIGDHAFRYCKSLTCIEIPNNVTNIGEGSFLACGNLTNIVVDIGNPIYDSRENCNAIIKTGSNTLIVGCQNSKIPISVRSIGDYAFFECDGLSSVEIPNSVTSVGSQAFWHCESLTNIEIPNSVISIGNGAFTWCPNLTSIIVDADNSVYDSRENCNAIIKTGSNTLIAGCQNSKIPNSVTSIGEFAFYYCSKLTSIEIPKNVINVGSQAFFCCTNLKEITCLAATPPAISQYTFYNCKADLYVPAGCKVAYESADYWKKFTNIIELPTLAESLVLDMTEASIEVNETVTFIAMVLPNNTTNKVVAWKSSDNTVATVSANGVVTAVALGEAVITATTTDGTNLSATCKVTVVPTLAETITLDKTEISLEATETATLVATVLPELTTNKSVTWTSSNEAVATVDANGVVTAIALGEAVITATTTDGTNLSATCKVTVVPTLAETITLDKIEISLEATETATLVATVLPELTTNKSVAWTSSNEAVATVDANGVVIAIAVGEAVITATTTDGTNLSATCKVTVVPTLAETITLDKTEISLEATETATLVATVLPELATNKVVTWKSSDESVATVDANGVVTAIAVGEATITATTTDGSNLSASCKVTVVPTLAETITLDKTEISLEATQTATLVAMVLPELATNKAVTWKSSNESVAIVDTNGVVTAIAVGEATITATTTDGSNLSATCKVTVVPTLVETITLDKTEISLEATETATLVATVLPELTTNKSVTWTSSNDAVATVDANGVVTAIAVGEATITATTTDGSNLSATCKVTVVATLAETITLDKTEISIEATETATLVATVLPELTTNKSVTWTSSNDAVATVDANGVVTAIAVGEAVITATTTDGSNLSAFCKVIVVPTLATSIELDKTEISLEATETATLVASVLPELTTDKSVTWKSSNEAVATVDANGVVTAIALGEAVITATTTDGSNLSEFCKVTVVPTLATSIEFDKTEISLEATETATLVATVLPELTTNKSVTWTSSNEAVATVDANGVVTAIALGEAVITATTTDGSNLSASCKVTVVPTLAETIVLDKTEIRLEATETATLVATVLPELTTDKSVKWSSSDETVVVVDENGVVTAVAVGEAVITATTTDGSNLSASCKVTVVPTLAETITLDKTEISLEATETATLVATVLPELTTNKSVTWTSSNEAVATVDANGVVTAIALGEAVITATTADGSNLSATCKVIVVPTLAETITLDKTEMSLEATETATLVATVLPELTTDKSVEWSSSDETVVVVDENGLVTAVAVGEATITAKTVDDSNLSATCKVTVIPTLATSIELDKTEISIEATETATLVATVLPELTTNKSVEWTSSNEAVATVDANGVVTAIALGEAIITAIATDGSDATATCQVTVIPTLAMSIELDKTEVSAEEKSDLQLTATILPEHTTNKEVAWSSSYKWVAKVDNTGLVTMYSAGEVIITATTTDGSNLSATCRINVYSGIDGVNGDDVIVATIGDNIVVKNAKLGSNVRVYAADGAMIATEIAIDGSVVIEAPIKGMYVVAIDGKSFKVMVK